MKYNLKTNFEGFFILDEMNKKILAWTETKENIIIINERYLFGKTNFKDPSHISDKKELKNNAFGVTIVLRHENNSHRKKNNKNKIFPSPLYYCENGVPVSIINEKFQIYEGEDGIAIESLITRDQTIIISLARDFIYGELLDYRLFIQKDFNELLEKIKLIQDAHSNKVFAQNQSINLNPNKIIEKNEMKDANIIGQINNKRLRELAEQAIREGLLKLGDQFYTLNEIKIMIETAKSIKPTNIFNPIFFEIDKLLNEGKNNGDE